MKRSWTILTSLLAVLMTLSLLAGCAAQMQKTEAGYKPTHLSLGQISVTFDGRMDRTQLREMITQRSERAFNKARLGYIPSDELTETDVVDDLIGIIEMSVSFQRDARSMTASQDARITFTIRRKSDNLVWLDGSASSSDLTTSQGMGVDLDSALRLAVESMVNKISAKMGQ